MGGISSTLCLVVVPRPVSMPVHSMELRLSSSQVQIAPPPGTVDNPSAGFYQSPLEISIYV
jgi:hypothetical protein